MPRLLNRVKVATATTGDGTITLGSAAADFQTFADADAVNGRTYSYVIEDDNGAWEIGVGVYTSSGTTLSRTLIESSTGSLLDLSGSATVFVSPNALDIAHPAKVTKFTSSGTYTRDPDARFVKIFAAAPGGGGGSGARYPTTSNRGGGGGAAGGGTTWGDFEAANMLASLTINIGSAGVGGAAVTTDNTNGNDGTNGGSISILNPANSMVILNCIGGERGRAGTNSAGGNAGNGTAFGSGRQAGSNGGNGTLTNGNGAPTTGSGIGGGGGGAGAPASGTTAASGGSGGHSAGLSGTRVGGSGGPSATGGDGGDGVGSSTFGGIDLLMSGGGGGGGYKTGQATGKGGKGGDYGGGGGGGAAADNGFNSGAGGDGGAGSVIVVEFY